MSISYLFEQRASFGEFKLATIQTPYESFEIAILAQYSSATTNFWSKVAFLETSLRGPLNLDIFERKVILNLKSS